MTAKEWRTSPLELAHEQERALGPGRVPKWAGSNAHVYLGTCGFTISVGPRHPDLTDDDARSLRDWLLDLFPLEPGREK